MSGSDQQAAPAQDSSTPAPRVLVAGATGGIGEGVCRELLRRGAGVVAVGRDEGRLQELAGRLRVGADRLASVTLDVTADHDAADRVWLADNKGSFDGVIIAVGAPGRPAPGTVLDIPVDDARQMMEINELGGLRALQTLVPLVRPAGAVVNVLGYSAEIPFPNNPLMGSTNAAMRSLLMTLAVQLRATGPRIYGLVVGVVRTRARQAAGIDNPDWLTGDEIGALAADLIAGKVPRPDIPLRYLLDPVSGPALTPPARR